MMWREETSGAVRGREQARGLARVSCRPRDADFSGVDRRPEGRRRRRCGAALRPEGRPRVMRGPRPGYSSASRLRRGPGFVPGWSGPRRPGPHRAPAARGIPFPGSCGAGYSAGRRPRPGARGCGRPGSFPWGSTGAAGPRRCSSLLPPLPPRVQVAEVAVQVGGQGESGRERPSSLPWSQVSDQRRCAGSVPAAAVIAAATLVCAVPAGRVQRHERSGSSRSASVPIADLLPTPRIRSPSQCPGTARSAASASRSLMITMPTIFPRRSPSLRRGLRRRRPGPQARRQLPPQRPAALHVVASCRLVRHPHLPACPRTPPAASR